MRSKHRPCSLRRTDCRRFPGKRAKRHPSSTASPDKDTPHHDDGPLTMVVADESEKNPYFSKYQALADQLRDVSGDTIGRLIGRGHNSGKRLYSLLDRVI